LDTETGRFWCSAAPVAWRAIRTIILSSFSKKRRDGDAIVPIRYDGDDKNGYSTDDEPHLEPDHRTLYFSSDRVLPAHFPRSPEQAQLDFKRLGSSG
jgi:hypothetical protein